MTSTPKPLDVIGAEARQFKPGDRVQHVRDHRYGTIVELHLPGWVDWRPDDWAGAHDGAMRTDPSNLRLAFAEQSGPTEQSQAEAREALVTRLLGMNTVYVDVAGEPMFRTDLLAAFSASSADDGAVKAAARAAEEAILLIDELNERAESRQFNGIDQTLHSKLRTVRATLLGGLKRTPAARPAVSREDCSECIGTGCSDAKSEAEGHPKCSACGGTGEITIADKLRRLREYLAAQSEDEAVSVIDAALQLLQEQGGEA